MEQIRNLLHWKTHHERHRSEWQPKLPPPQNHSTVEALAERLLASVRQPVDTPAGRHDISASIGIAYLPSDGRAPAELLKAADLAMYQAKQNGRNGWVQANMAGPQTQREY